MIKKKSCKHPGFKQHQNKNKDKECNFLDFMHFIHSRKIAFLFPSIRGRFLQCCHCCIFTVLNIWTDPVSSFWCKRTWTKGKRKRIYQKLFQCRIGEKTNLEPHTTSTTTTKGFEMHDHSHLFAFFFFTTKLCFMVVLQVENTKMKKITS